MDNNNLKPKSIGGISFTDEVAKPSTPSYQNQSSQFQGGKSSGPNKSVIVCWVLGAIAVILLIVLIVAIVKKKDSSDDKKENITTEVEDTEGKTESTTESDTDETTESTTDATTTQATTGYQYVAPTSFSGDWRDFQISINGDYYQFPFPYYELGANGWTIDTTLTEVGSGDTEAIFAISSVSGNKFMFDITNPHATAQPLENCLITGLFVDSDCTEDEIKLADDIIFLSSVKQDFLDEFGAPDWAYEDGDMEYVYYNTDDLTGRLELEVDSNKVCYRMCIENLAMPEGLEASTELPTEEPEINASYVAPTGPSTELTDNIVTIEGYNYKLPCPVSEFIKNGWEIDSKSDEYIYSNDYILSALEKDGEKIYCYLANYTGDTIYSFNGMVTMLDVYQEYAGEVDITFPGNMGIGKNATDFEATFGGYESFVCDRDDEYEGLYYNVSIPLSGDNESIFIWLECDYNTGEIIEYQYEYINY